MKNKSILKNEKEGKKDLFNLFILNLKKHGVKYVFKSVFLIEKKDRMVNTKCILEDSFYLKNKNNETDFLNTFLNKFLIEHNITTTKKNNSIRNIFIDLMGNKDVLISSKGEGEIYFLKYENEKLYLYNFDNLE